MIDVVLGIFPSVKALLGHPQTTLLTNSIGMEIITICSQCGIAGALKRLWPLIMKQMA